MSDNLSWTAIAALIGASLGVINLVRSMWVDRPIIFLAPAAFGGTTNLRLNIINMSKRPLLLRRVSVYPKDIYLYSDSENMFDRTLFEPGPFGSITRRFTKIVHSSEDTFLALFGLERGGWCILIVTWSQGYTIWPWSVVWEPVRVINDLCDAANPVV